MLKVLPGTKVPADGMVVWGSSYVNESMVTGEAIPVSKEVNSLVIGGTINLHGALHIQVTKVGSDTVLSQIINLVETAQMSKAPIQKFADFVSAGNVVFELVCPCDTYAIYEYHFQGYCGIISYKVACEKLPSPPIFLALLYFH